MIEHHLPVDLDTPFGERVIHHLTHAQIIWLTAVDAGSQPHPNPLWFVWEGDSVLFYSKPGAIRLIHFQHNPHVSLHFDTDPLGDDVVVLYGTAAIITDAPPVTEVTAYVEKYRDGMVHIDMTPEVYAREFSVGFRVKIEAVRGYYVPPGDQPQV